MVGGLVADLTPWLLLGVLCTGRPDIDRVCRGVEIPAETRAECLGHAAAIRSMLPAHIRLIWQECQSERQQAARRAAQDRKG